MTSVYAILAAAMMGNTISQKVCDALEEAAASPKQVDRISTTCTVRIMPGDTFDLTYGYCLLNLEQALGSKRKRKMYLENRYGELLTPALEKELTIAATLDMMNMTYPELLKHIKDIYANDKRKS